MVDFSVNKDKVVEALVYITDKAPGLTPFFISKIVYFADLWHLTEFGRPVTGDTMVAMENGPVPSFAYRLLNGETTPPPGSFAADRSARHPTFHALRRPNLDRLSATDRRMLDRAIEHCRSRSFGQLSDETHKHPAWIDAVENRPMSFDRMLADADPKVVEEAEEFAAYGVL